MGLIKSNNVSLYRFLTLHVMSHHGSVGLFFPPIALPNGEIILAYDDLMTDIKTLHRKKGAS